MKLNMKICTIPTKRTINWRKDANFMQLFNTKVTNKLSRPKFTVLFVLKQRNNSLLVLK